MKLHIQRSCTVSHLTLPDLEKLYNYRSGLLTKVESNQVLRLIIMHEKRTSKHNCTKVNQVFAEIT